MTSVTQISVPGSSPLPPLPILFQGTVGGGPGGGGAGGGKKPAKKKKKTAKKPRPKPKK